MLSKRQIDLIKPFFPTGAWGFSHERPACSNRIFVALTEQAARSKRLMIETMFVKLKSSGRVATKYDQCAHTFMSAIHIAVSFTFYLEESVLKLDGHPAWRASVVDHCTFRFSANYALQLQVTHQTHSYTPGNRNTLAMQPQPDFPNTIDTEMLVEDAKDFGVKASFPPFTYGPMLRVASCPQLLLGSGLIART